MNTVFRRRLGSLAVGVVATLLVASAGQGQVPCQYDVTIIQAPECPIFGFPPTIGLGLSEHGHVVGYHFDCEFIDDEAFAWTPETGLVTLPFPAGTIRKRAFDIEGGLIVGRFDVLGDGLGDLAFMHDGDGLMVIPPPAGSFSVATAINGAGRVAGTTADGSPHFKAFLWDKGVMTLIEPSFGSTSAASDISSDMNSHIVGWMGTAVGIDSHAFVWQDGRLTDLGLPPNTFASWANATNNIGQVLVRGDFNDDDPTDRISGSFLWDSGDFADLGALPGYDVIAGLDLNDHGQVVGICRAVDSSNAPDAGFIWRKGVMTDLNDVIPEGLGILIGRADAINNAGEIITTASLNGDTVAALLTPVGVPLGDLDGDCQTGITDLLTLLSEWGEANSPADFDGDGTVGILDLLTLLANWTEA